MRILPAVVSLLFGFAAGCGGNLGSTSFDGAPHGRRAIDGSGETRGPYEQDGASQAPDADSISQAETGSQLGRFSDGGGTGGAGGGADAWPGGGELEVGNPAPALRPDGSDDVGLPAAETGLLDSSLDPADGPGHGGDSGPHGTGGATSPVASGGAGSFGAGGAGGMAGTTLSTATSSGGTTTSSTGGTSATGGTTMSTIVSTGGMGMTSTGGAPSSGGISGTGGSTGSGMWCGTGSVTCTGGLCPEHSQCGANDTCVCPSGYQFQACDGTPCNGDYASTCPGANLKCVRVGAGGSSGGSGGAGADGGTGGSMGGADGGGAGGTGGGSGGGTGACPTASDPSSSSCGNNVYNSHGCSSCPTENGCRSGNVTIVNGSYYCDSQSLYRCNNGTLVEVMSCAYECRWYGPGTGTSYPTSCWDEDPTTQSSRQLNRTSGPGCYYAGQMQCSA